MYYMLWKLLNTLSERHIWMEVELIAETRKAILVRFDNRDAWIPKIWIVATKARKSGITRPTKLAKKSSIKISETHWAKKFL